MIKTNGSKIWPLVIAGSAIGGTVACLFMTESGRKFRRGLRHPNEMANNIDEVRDYVEHKTRIVTGRIHDVIDTARRGIEEGERAYREAGQRYRARTHEVENMNQEVTSGVHHTVDRMSRTAVRMEQSVLDPLCEMGALYRGIEQGIRALFGKHRRTLRGII